MCIRDRETPGPIPNPEAKPFSADGTALVTVWESRTPPDIHCERAPTANTGRGLFCVCRRLARLIELSEHCLKHPRRMEAGPCLLTRLPAARAMIEVVGEVHPDAPSEAAVSLVVLLRAATGGVDGRRIVLRGT